MNASENFTSIAAAPPAFPPSPSVPCSVSFNPFDCVAIEQFDTEHRFLAIVILALAFAVLTLCVLVGVLTMLVHKIGSIWMTAILGIGKTAGEKDDANDNPRKELLGGSIRSSLSSSKSKAEGKKKKASFVEDTSCAPPRDVDEEDL